MFFQKVIFSIFLIVHFTFGNNPDGWNGAPWGSANTIVKEKTGATQWIPDTKNNTFPPNSNITVFTSSSQIAGYKAKVSYYFWKDQFFQATIKFDFQELVNFDFNYNVYRSVHEYYMVIRSKTNTFVYDIYDLLSKKYGKKEPVFKGLDPKFIFIRTDAYIKKERWNLRYHPYDFYQKIVASAYARWDFPKTKAIFSVNIAAAEKRFDYQLSLTSVSLENKIRKEIDSLRMGGL